MIPNLEEKLKVGQVIEKIIWVRQNKAELAKMTTLEKKLFALGMILMGKDENAAQVICEALDEMQRLRRSVERLKAKKKSVKK